MSPDVMILCGPAKGTEDKPYRCICCRRAFADIEQLAVSICWGCMGDDPTCASCRRRGVFINDERVGRWPDDLTQGYDPEGGLGHRLDHHTTMVCGARIPRKHWGGASGVVPGCPTCWPDGYGA